MRTKEDITADFYRFLKWIPEEYTPKIMVLPDEDYQELCRDDPKFLSNYYSASFQYAYTRIALYSKYQWDVMRTAESLAKRGEKLCQCTSTAATHAEYTSRNLDEYQKWTSTLRSRVLAK